MTSVRRATRLALTLTLALVTASATPLSAQPSRRPRETSIPAVATALDTWLAVRFRGVELLPDSLPPGRSIAANASLARIESVGANSGGGANDTLFALHFADRPGAPALPASGRVRLASPTGTITPTGAQVVSRRPFRAPRTPAARSSEPRDWRYGWAFVSLLPRAGRRTPVATFRGWLLLDASGTR